MNDLKQKILAKVSKDLEAIEVALKSNLNPYVDLVSQTAKHILFSGGKRLRPLLMVLSARICGYTGDYDKTFSTIFEYLHAATLLHDDLIDDASLRRGKEVANLKWGNSVAVLVGDFLYSRSLSIASETNCPKIIKIIATITEDMSQGEIHQLTIKGKLDLSEAEYMEVIRRKTAELYQGACRTGALIADAKEGHEKALATYGLNIGLAFQMADDLLDYTSDTHTLGKEIGADLKEGKLTLPVIHALRTAKASDQHRIKEIISNPDFSVSDFNTLLELLDQYDSIEHTKNTATTYVTSAKEALLVFEPSETRELLYDLADYAMVRKA